MKRQHKPAKKRWTQQHKQISHFHCAALFVFSLFSSFSNIITVFSVSHLTHATFPLTDYSKITFRRQHIRALEINAGFFFDRTNKLYTHNEWGTRGWTLLFDLTCFAMSDWCLHTILSSRMKKTVVATECGIALVRILGSAWVTRSICFVWKSHTFITFTMIFSLKMLLWSHAPYSVDQIN